ncbi:MAG TPA: CRTAC1 family protein [Kofleriaceae bacterium]
MFRWVCWSLAALAACGGAPDPDAPGGPTCGDPARGPRSTQFADATARAGVRFVYQTTGLQGGGLAVVDLDGDGRPDILAGNRDGGLTLFHNLGGLAFADRTAAAGLDPAGAATAIAAADLDNDGDLDLVITGRNQATVLANQGDGRFAVAATLDDVGTSQHILPVDLDGDGQLDLYISNYDRSNSLKSQNRLYLNRGGLQLARMAMPASDALTWSATAFDFDGDGDQDLYVAHDTLLSDFGQGPTEPAAWPGDLLLRNDGPATGGAPALTDLAAQLGLATPRSSMGGVLADFDGDGRLDLYVPDFGAKKLFLRTADGGFAEAASRLGVDAIERRNAACAPGSTSEDCLLLSWSAAVTDFDLDGHDELLLVSGKTSPTNPPPVVLLTRGAEDEPFHEVAPDISCMDGRGLVVTDLDGDGDQDVVVAQLDGPLLIYENTGQPAAGTWLDVRLRGTASNRDGVGATVAVRQASGRGQIRAVGAGGVIDSAAPAEAFFGLGHDPVTAIDVQWPSGRHTTWTAAATGQILAGALVIEEP